MMKTEILKAQTLTEAFLKAAQAVRDGAIAVFPTDTVYGIGTNFFSPDGIKKIYKLKGRPDFKPLPVLVSSLEAAQKLAQWTTPQAQKLAEAFWPGPLTMILKPLPSCAEIFPDAPGIGLRIPNHPFLLEWLKLLDAPLAATSANFSGEPAIISEEEMLEKYSGSVDYIFTGGTLAGTESSVVDLTRAVPVILREGALSKETVLKLIQQV